jgi:hypothetical protein
MDSTIVIGTIIFIVLWIIVSIIIMMIANKGVNDPRLKGEYRGMSLSLTFLGAFCMWLMWISVYMHQKNPLIQPILKEKVPIL